MLICSSQTADTYRASATFLDLLGIWPPIDAELAAKSKYAKYHALRIAKAIKAGEDPNASNPAPEPEPESELPLDPNDPDVQIINNAASLQPHGEDDSGPSAPSPPIEVPPLQPPGNAAQSHMEVSPLEPSPNANSRANSVGGGYFPAVPTFTSEPSAPSLPTAPPAEDVNMKSPQDDIDPSSFYSAPPPADLTPIPPPNHAISPAVHSPVPPPQPSYPTQPVPAPVPPPAAVPIQGGPYRNDDEAVMNAQKHARWAISALNFEDVNTAVKELRIALQSLGAG